MDENEVRELCLSLVGATETFPFDPETPVYKTSANNKIFAIMSVPGSPSPSVSVKCDPEDSVALRETYPAITPGYHLNKKHWVSVDLTGDVPADIVEHLVRDSHALVKPKVPRARQQ